MCLESVQLNLEYNEEEKDFVGYGYKSLILCDKTGRINFSVPTIKKHWTEAKCDLYVKRVNPLLSKTRSCNNKEYWPGFHIFLDIEDAKKYNTCGTIVKVMFKGVTSFGYNQSGTNKCGKCVVSRYAKIVEIIKKCL